MSAQWQQMQQQDDYASAIHKVEFGMAGEHEAEVIKQYVDDLWLKLESEEMKNGD